MMMHSEDLISVSTPIGEEIVSARECMDQTDETSFGVATVPTAGLRARYVNLLAAIVRTCERAILVDDLSDDELKERVQYVQRALVATNTGLSKVERGLP